MKTNPNTQTGFALLMAIIVVGVILSVGLTILDLSIKQVRLSTNAKESEVAFHAANAGMECARYIRRVNDTAMESGQAISPRCFDESPSSNTINTTPGAPTLDDTSDGEAHLYEYSFSWAGNSRCTQIYTLVASSTATGDGIDVTNVDTLLPGYPDGTTKTCEAGARCTVISVQGYNKPCSVVSTGSNFGIVQREVLLQF